MITNQQLLNQKKDLLINFSKIELSQSLSLNFHGIPLEFKTNSKSISELITENYKIFISHQSFQDAKIINIRDCKDLSIKTEDWCDEPSQDCWREKTDHSEIAIQRDFAGEYKADDEINLIIDSSYLDGLQNFLRWYLPKELFKLKRFVIHSSCIMDQDNHAHLFLGHSGAGKTTMAERAMKWKSLKVLSDDMNLVFEKDGVFYIQSSYMGGVFEDRQQEVKSYPLKSLYWLQQDKKNEVIQIPQSKGVLKLMASITNLFWNDLNEQEISVCLNFCHSLLSNISMAEFKNNLSLNALEIIPEFREES